VATQTLEQLPKKKKVALLFGNEGAGLGRSYVDLSDAAVKIPIRSGVESLNVAVAHGILAWQLRSSLTH
jgi:TrmH family RNA methyltransferase